MGNPIIADPINCRIGPADLGLRRDEIHEARKLRDAEREQVLAPRPKEKDRAIPGL